MNYNTKFTKIENGYYRAKINNVELWEVDELLVLAIKERDKEIERLNNKVKELMTLYTTERYVKEDYKAIIKEVREQINKDRAKNDYEKDGLMKQAFYCNKTDKLLEILNKVEEK